MIPVSARNIQFVGHTDQNGRGDGVQVIVHKGHAFIGHMFSDGFTITDVSDPRQPRPVNFVAALKLSYLSSPSAYSSSSGESVANSSGSG